MLVAQEAANRILKQGHGTMLFNGVSAGVEDFSKSAPFAMGKFALPGYAKAWQERSTLKTYMSRTLSLTDLSILPIKALPSTVG